MVTKPKLTKMKLVNLVVNEAYFPRQSIDRGKIRQMVDALEAGRELPPLIATPEHQIVDGVHRFYAQKQFLGVEGEIPVEVRTYASEEDLWQDIITLNVGRGSDLTSWDIARVIEITDGVVAHDKLARWLNKTPEKLEQLRKSRMARDAQGKPISIKNKIRHMLDQRLTQAQEAALDKMTGTPPHFDIEQLITLLTSDLVPYDNRHVELLEDLARAVVSWLSTHPRLNEGEENVG